MLNRQKVIAALEDKRSQFESYLDSRQHQRRAIEDQLDAFLALDKRGIEERLDISGVKWPGARPTDEFDRSDGLALPFEMTWANHRDARSWALETLYERPVLAVDGSQITPNKDFSIPIGAVQIGWFVNKHIEGGQYVKDLNFEILGPDELGDDADEDADGFPNWRVNQQRFVGECRKLCELMVSYADDETRPLCFFDGSFVISFAGQIRPQRAVPYLRAVMDLLSCSEQVRVPLVGFVDSSYSHDLVHMIETLSGSKQHLAVSDGALVHSLLPNWGDRTPFFVCARADSLSTEDRAPFYTDVAFCYIRLAQERAPARLEIPRWLLEADLADGVVDLVRAECVVGTGYPYAIESADALAVISQQDRQRFYGLFEQFAARDGWPLTRPRKTLSKQARR